MNNQKDVMFNTKDLMNLIIPIFIELLLATTIGIADTIMVSSVGEAVVSSVALVDSLNMLLISIFAAVSTGASVVIAQYIGSNDKNTAKLVACQALLASILLASIIMIICLIMGNNILILLYGKSEQAVLDNSSIYFTLSLISYPFLAIHSTCSAIFRSTRNSRITMYISLVMNIINVTGNAILIFGFKLGIAGAGIATLLSRITGSLIMVILLLQEKRIINLRGFFPIKFKLDILKKILTIGIPAGTESVIFQVGKVITQNYITGFGTAHMAANAVAGSIFSLTCMPGNALHLAIITIVGQCVGASKYKEAKNYIIKIIIYGAVLLSITNIVTYLFINQILVLYSLSESSIIIAKKLVFYNCFAQSLFWAPAFILPNALRGSSDVKYTMIVSISTMWVLRVFFGYILAIVFNLGVVGVWLAMFTDWVFRAGLFIWRLFNNKWMNKKIV